VACALWESPLVDEKIWDGEGNLSLEKKEEKKSTIILKERGKTA
jgi:hypothetical protein